ncbi:hypothetical protein BP6252_00886 [Coleophoma cylindrospora]|uniref:Mediator of RNA polymerase II transcription subunit 16 n=1 Tax=Coleophoma cylindrospora TaxID=1849047 RepID=A0A3D8SRK9_9HELO|nr:hypothetical protein BP6252_00886 [Coleophoma cylindrospora]
MDDEMSMADLFGEGADLALPSLPSLPSRPPSKELHQRIDELRQSGGRQSIAWSKWGSIASIHPNGTQLELRNLRCHPEDGTWALSEPSETPPLTSDLEGGPLKHLSWSPSGSELAVIDAAGRITILGLASTINKPTLSRNAGVDVADDLHAVVGCYWLNLPPNPTNRPQTVCNGPAIREGSSFKYEAFQAPLWGPYHPLQTKSAFVCVTTNGLLRFLWPQPNGKWFELHTELESIVSSEDLITHASICPDRTFATASKQLRTMRVLIDWGLPKTAEKVPPGVLSLNPSIKPRHLAVTSWLQEGQVLNASHLESSMVQLSHLEILPPSGDIATGRIAPPVIIAIRTHLPISTTHYNQDVHTTVDRWEIREKQQNIHPAFEQLSSRRNSVGTQPGVSLHPQLNSAELTMQQAAVFLKKIQSFTINKVVIGIQPINLGKVICFAYSDSSVEYRDRYTMSEVFNDGDLDKVWHLSQIGFTYAEDEPCLQMALSPTSCSMVQIRNDGKVKWKQLDYHGDIGSSMEDGQYAATIAAFTLSCSTAVMTGINVDDLLANAYKFNKKDFVLDWLTELSKILKNHVDYSQEVHFDPLIRNTAIQLCLTIQVSLGFKGEFFPRSFAGKFGWIVLQLRSFVVLVTMAANMKVASGPSNERSSPLENPEVISALAGSVRWTLDLMAWITDTLLTLPTSMPSLKNGKELSMPDLLNHLRSTNNVSLHLLLCSAARGYLIAACRRLTHLDYIARKTMQLTTGGGRDSQGNPIPQGQSMPSALSPALRAAYMQIATLTATATLKITTFENLLSSITTSVKTEYANQKSSPSGSPVAEKQRNALELKMLFGGDFPDAFQPVIIELFGTLLPATREDIDPGKLFFMDFSMLEVDDDEGKVGGKELKRRKEQGLTMDCFAKKWLSNPKQPSTGSHSLANGFDGNSVASGRLRWRRCARCAAVMEDVLSSKPSLHWLMMQQRRCFCSGYWDTLQQGHLVA